MKNKIEFPQPMVAAPEIDATYYYVDDLGQICDTYWSNDAEDKARLNACKVYSSEEGALDRSAYDAQEMARLVIPAWFRALGPDVEFCYGKGWMRANGPSDWSTAKPADYRAKKRDVVVAVNGVEYRWPPCVEKDAPIGPRHIVSVAVTNDNERIFAVMESAERSAAYGNRTHHTREGAQAMADALNAVLKEAM